MHLSYLPARLVKGISRWYILYYQVNPLTNQRERFRETYDLNRIVDLNERQIRADKIIEQLNARLPLGFPFESVDAQSKLNIIKAIQLAFQIKSTSIRKRTQQTLTSIVNVFTDFLRHEGLMEMNIGDFRKKHAIAFFDYAIMVRGVGNRTYNNYLERIRTLFAVLEEREYLHENPFAGFKKKRVNGKNRRAFNEQERALVADYIKKNDRWLFLGVILQYYCFIRPIELRRLRFYMIDLKEGIIRLTGKETKNKENAIITCSAKLTTSSSRSSKICLQDHGIK